MGAPTVHPTGVTIYNPEKCFNGYTLFQACEQGATLIDMNGGVVNHWHNLQGFPNKLLRGGYVIGSLGERSKEYGTAKSSGNLTTTSGSKILISDRAG